MAKKVKEGRKLKSLPPYNKISPYIMVLRNDAQNFIRDSINVDKAEEYIRKKRNEGLRGFGMLHLLVASYVRTVSQRPAINRFIRGQRVHARTCIEVMLTIKKEISLDSPDTCLKLLFRPEFTADEVYAVIQNAIDESRGDETDFDGLAKALNYIPGLFMKATVSFLKTMDYFGLVPRKLTLLSPFHGSMAITSMGSLGIPPIYHHLYNFGNIPVFIAFGAKYFKNELKLDGTVERNKYIDYTVVTDERICDGFYFASALKVLKDCLYNPDKLDTPPETVLEDIR